jgi:uncharacterized membrane protein YkvA (DUF1232 family)
MTSEQRVTIELNPKEKRLYDRLRQKVIEPNPKTPVGARDLLLLLPDFTILLSRLMRDDRVPMHAKAIALIGVGYVISPIDLMPALLFGPLGILDDLVVVAAATSRLMNHVHPDVVRSHWSGKTDVLEALLRVSSWSSDLFGGRAKGLVRGLFRLPPTER